MPTSSNRPPSLASIKRSIGVGTKVTLTHHGACGPGDTLPWGQGERTLPMTREVAVVQSNAIAFDDPASSDGRSWLYWPRAGEIQVTGERSFTIGGYSAPMSYVIEN